MEFDQLYQWLIQSERRKQVVATFNQPLTAKQLSKRTGLHIDSCSFVFWQLEIYRLLYCLNAKARTNRVHWLTELGKAIQRSLREQQNLPPLLHHFPDIDWVLYGAVCFSHRAAVIKALSYPMQPADIKRRARAQQPRLRMSANNVRDVIRIFIDYGIVKPVWVRKRAHPLYELTQQAKVFRDLLLRAEQLP